MGAWGINNFENDDALDWVGEFCDEPSEETLKNVFVSVNEIGDEYLESPEASSALVAAEIVGALKNHPSADLPENVRQCIKALDFNLSDEMVSDAIKAVERVKSESELKELWEETEDFSQWNEIVDNLIDRLKS